MHRPAVLIVALLVSGVAQAQTTPATPDQRNDAAQRSRIVELTGNIDLANPGPKDPVECDAGELARCAETLRKTARAWCTSLGFKDGFPSRLTAQPASSSPSNKVTMTAVSCED